MGRTCICIWTLFYSADNNSFDSLPQLPCDEDFSLADVFGLLEASR